MPKNYNPLTGHELALAIDQQVRKALNSRPDLFGHHLTYRAFRFAVGISIDFLDGRGEGQIASSILPTIESAQGEFAQALANPTLSGKVWLGVGFSHLLTLPPDQARAELHLPTREIVAEGGQMIEKEVPPPHDPLLDAPPPPLQPLQRPPAASAAAPPTPAELRSASDSPLPAAPTAGQLSEAEIAEMFEAPPTEARVPVPQTARVPASPTTQQLDPTRAAQLAAQARANPAPSANNPFDHSGPIEPRDVQTLRPRPPHQTVSERLNSQD